MSGSASVDVNVGTEGAITVLSTGTMFTSMLNIKQVGGTGSMSLTIECVAETGEEALGAIKDKMSEVAFWIENHYDLQLGASNRD